MGKLPDGEIVSDRRDEASEEGPEPATQPTGLRRQQRLVAIGIAVLGGAALAISAVQQFPERPLFFPVVSGILGAVVLFWLVSKGMVTGEGEDDTAESENEGAADSTADDVE